MVLEAPGTDISHPSACYPLSLWSVNRYRWGRKISRKRARKGKKWQRGETWEPEKLRQRGRSRPVWGWNGWLRRGNEPTRPSSDLLLWPLWLLLPSKTDQKMVLSFSVPRMLVRQGLNRLAVERNQMLLFFFPRFRANTWGLAGVEWFRDASLILMESNFLTNGVFNPNGITF